MRRSSPLPPHKRNIGMVFQSYALFPHIDVFHNIAFPLKQRGVPGLRDGRSVEKALDLVKLQGLGERRSTSSPAASVSAWRWRAPSCSSRASC